jgi:hypothetical protein
MTNITHEQNEQLISEAVVASYIRDISGHQRRHQTANQRALYELRRPPTGGGVKRLTVLAPSRRNGQIPRNAARGQLRPFVPDGGM